MTLFSGDTDCALRVSLFEHCSLELPELTGESDELDKKVNESPERICEYLQLALAGDV